MRRLPGQGAVRETYEEAGVSGVLGAPVYVHDHSRKNGRPERHEFFALQVCTAASVAQDDSAR